MRRLPFALAPLLLAAALYLAASRPPQAPPPNPVRHVVVIFSENISFDHYFGTYPHALNPPGEPRFTALPNTPIADGLTPALLLDNPNLNAANGADGGNPFRLDRTQGETADQDHSYKGEQTAFDHGAMDLFPKSVGKGGAVPRDFPPGASKGATMGYFDGNTVTALWNYAQRFAMSDRSFGTTFGPSTVGAINLVAGQTNGAVVQRNGGANVADGGAGSSTLIGDVDPVGDVCSTSSGAQLSMSGKNVGDLLNAAGFTWGWFQGGFNLAAVSDNGTTGCLRSSYSRLLGASRRDYVPHHEPFQYYASTANPTHARPTSVATIGHTDAANHQYDLDDFFAAVSAGNVPAVSFLKARAFENGHAGTSDPLDEQAFFVRVINFLQQQPDWRNTVVFIAWDDSDGWYDHVMGPTVNGSGGAADSLTAAGVCGNPAAALPGIDPANAHALGRCGYGPRLPLLAISPWAKSNFVDHGVSDQTSVLRFIEDHLLKGQRLGKGSFDQLAGSLDSWFDFNAATPPNAQPLFLDEGTGQPVAH